MNSEWLKSGVPTAHLNGRQRVEGKVDIQRLFRAIDSDPAIVGAGVVYIESDFTLVTLREFQPLCSIAPKKIVLREAPKFMAAQEFVRVLETQARESQLVAELIGASLACSGVVLSILSVKLGTALLPFTAGVSSIIVVVGGLATASTIAQCAIGLGRVYFEIVKPSVNDDLDNEKWYQPMILVLDAISLLGVGASGVVTWRVISTAKRSTGKSLRDILRGLTRQERVKLNDEVLLLKHPGLTPKLLKLKKASGELSKRYSSAAVRRATIFNILGAVGAANTSAGCAYSGVINAVAIILYEEMD